MKGVTVGHNALKNVLPVQRLVSEQERQGLPAVCREFPW
jgi:hypothetical protein